MRLLSRCGALLLGLSLSTGVLAADLLVAAGAGYRQLVEALVADFGAQSGLEVERTYGNMGQVAAQVKMGTGIQLVVGDHRYLSTSGVEYQSYHDVGEGRLVLAWRQGLELDSPDALSDAGRFARIALPDTDKAIYGRAGSQYLERSGLIDTLDERLLVVGTVPQATAYVATGEVDAGFINLTDALANAERFGGHRVLDEHYDPIRIVAAVTAQHADAPAVLAFIDYLGDLSARTIATEHGL